MERARVSEVMSRHGLDGLVATTSENVTYLTDFFPAIGPHPTRRSRFWAVCPADLTQEIGVLCPRINLQHAAQTDLPVSDIRTFGSYGYELPAGADLSDEEKRLVAMRERTTEDQDPFHVLVDMLRDRRLDRGVRLGVDEMALSHDDWKYLQSLLGDSVVLVDAYDIFREIRMVKTPAEVNRIRDVLKATHEAISDTIAIIHEGVPHYQVWETLRRGMTDRGMTPGIVTVGIGPSSVFSYTLPSKRRAQAGDLVKFDCGGWLNGYLSDTARTGVVGTPTPKQQRYYDAILAGQQAGIAAVKPGAAASDVFRVIRDEVRRSGIPTYGRPGLGHGIGREIYDLPIIKEDDDTVLMPGMILNIEAPYYEFGFGGVQVEDTGVVTETGYEYLSKLGHELFVCK